MQSLNVQKKNASVEMTHAPLHLSFKADLRTQKKTPVLSAHRLFSGKHDHHSTRIHLLLPSESSDSGGNRVTV